MPCDFGIAAETHPIIVLRNVAHNSFGKVPDNAFLAKHVRTLDTTVDFSALAAPTTVQLAAIVTFVEFTAVVECVALLALDGSDDRMHAKDVLLVRCRTDVLAT